MQAQMRKARPIFVLVEAHLLRPIVRLAAPHRTCFMYVRSTPRLCVYVAASFVQEEPHARTRVIMSSLKDLVRKKEMKTRHPIQARECRI
jgi:hypothetical protein